MWQKDYRHLRSQHTVASAVAFVGAGLQFSRQVTLQVLPAPADAGITAKRCDLPEAESRFVIRLPEVVDNGAATVIANAHGHQLAHVEHLLSALAGLGIDNAKLIVDGPELPAMDGSALPFVSAIANVGVQTLDVPRDVLLVRRSVCMQQGDAWALLQPSPMPRVTVCGASRDAGAPGQEFSVQLSPDVYTREIAAARTFGLAEAQWQARCRARRWNQDCAKHWRDPVDAAAGAACERFPDEFVRHKVLDIIGDLALLGLPLLGRFRTNDPGHGLTRDLLQLLLNRADSWQRVAAPDLLDGRVRLPVDAVGDQPDCRPMRVSR